MCGSPFPPGKKSGPDPWQSEDDHRTLTRAAEVTADPQRMKGVARHQTKIKKGLSQVGKLIGSRR